MPGCQKLINPSKDALADWLKNARIGDQCQVLTEQGDVYAHLTNLKPVTAKLPSTGFMGQEKFLSHRNRFMELLEILGKFNGQS
jgi:hypothetical protein